MKDCLVFHKDCCDIFDRYNDYAEKMYAQKLLILKLLRKVDFLNDC